MGCTELSATYVNMLNGFMLGMSLVVIAYSAYLTAELRDFGEAVDTAAIVTPLAFACIFFVASIVGFVAVRKRNKILLCIYLFFAFCVTIVVLACGAVLLSFSDTLDGINSDTLQNTTSSIVERVVDFELAVFEVCCTRRFDSIEDSPELCGGEVQTGCISDQDRFEDFVDDIPQSLCDNLEEVGIQGSPIVGDPEENGGCGGGDPAEFTERISDFLADNLFPLGVTNVVLSVVMLLDLMATCVLLCSSRDEYLNKQQSKKKESQFKEQAAPEYAGTDTDIRY